MPNWQYYNPVKIHFGPAIVRNLPHIVGSQRSILITTPGFTKRGITDSLKKLLGNSLVAVFDGVQPNPNFSSIKAAFHELQQYEYQTIIALGGGSTIDTAKVVAASGASGSELWIDNHLKRGAHFPEPFNPKPVIAIPTTAGTGSEVTMWATVWDMEEKKKYSLSHPSLYPAEAILDPELTLTLPEEETVYSGLDALSHAVESIWNKNANPVSDIFALQVISLVFETLPKLKSDLKNANLRSSMLRASVLAGLAFSNTKTAIAHSISYPLTAHFGLPHGLACSLPLPHVLKMYRDYLGSKEEEDGSKPRSKQPIGVTEQELVNFFYKLGISLNLKEYGISIADLKTIMNDCFTPERASNYIFETSLEDIQKIILSMYG